MSNKNRNNDWYYENPKERERKYLEEERKKEEIIKKEWEEGIKRVEMLKEETKKQLDKFNEEVTCNKCEFYFEKPFTHKYKDNSIYCNGCFSYLQKNQYAK